MTFWRRHVTIIKCKLQQDSECYIYNKRGGNKQKNGKEWEKFF